MRCVNRQISVDEGKQEVTKMNSDLWGRHWGRGGSRAPCSAGGGTAGSSWPWCWWCSWGPPGLESPRFLGVARQTQVNDTCLTFPSPALTTSPLHSYFTVFTSKRGGEGKTTWRLMLIRDLKAHAKRGLCQANTQAFGSLWLALKPAIKTHTPVRLSSATQTVRFLAITWPRGRDGSVAMVGSYGVMIKKRSK